MYFDYIIDAIGPNNVEFFLRVSKSSIMLFGFRHNLWQIILTFKIYGRLSYHQGWIYLLLQKALCLITEGITSQSLEKKILKYGILYFQEKKNCWCSEDMSEPRQFPRRMVRGGPSEMCFPFVLVTNWMIVKRLCRLGPFRIMSMDSNKLS